jgi:hypothetical protein
MGARWTSEQPEMKLVKWFCLGSGCERRWSQCAINAGCSKARTGTPVKEKQTLPAPATRF